jgi:hypothetical protein
MTFSDFMSGLASAAVTVSSPARLRERIGSLFDSDISPTQSELDAQAAGNSDRTRIYAENSSLAAGFSGEYTKQVVPPVLEPFATMKHSEIMSFVESIKPSEMNASVQGWKQLAKDTTAKATAFHDGIQNEMKSGWAGNAANQALASTKRYLDDVHKVDQAASLIGNKMDEAYSGFNQVKYSVPHESDNQSNSKMGMVVSVLAPLSGLVIDSQSAGRADAAQAAARTVMETVYKPVAQQSDTQVPKVPTPTNPQSDKPTGDTSQDKPNGTTTDKPGGTTTKPSTDDTTPSTTEPETPTTDDPGDATTDDQTTDDTTGDDTTAATTTPETPTTTTPSGTTPGTTPAGTSPGGLGSGGGAGAGAGSGAGAGAGTPGAAVPGTAGQKQGAGAGAGAGSGASSGRAGMSGMGGMGAPGARGGGKDDENEHQAPDYLRGVHEELLGPERLHVPPVIGGDA